MTGANGGADFDYGLEFETRSTAADELVRRPSSYYENQPPTQEPVRQESDLLPRASALRHHRWLDGRRGVHPSPGTADAFGALAVPRQQGHVDQTVGSHTEPDAPAFPEEFDPAWPDPTRFAE
jgi:hypothetical protein